MDFRRLTALMLCLITVLPWYGAEAEVDAGKARLEERRERFKAAFVEADVAVLETIVAPHYTHTNDRSEPLDREGWLASMRRRQDAMNEGCSDIIQFDSKYFPLRIHGDTAVVTRLTTLRGIRDGSEYGMLIISLTCGSGTAPTGTESPFTIHTSRNRVRASNGLLEPPSLPLEVTGHMRSMLTSDCSWCLSSFKWHRNSLAADISGCQVTRRLS